MTGWRSLGAAAALLAMFATLVGAPSARADPVDSQVLPSAQAILDRAKQLMAQQRYDEACTALEEVVRLVPSGVGAKMTLAKCYEAAGRLTSAWAAFLVASNAARELGQLDRAKTALDRATALRPRLATLTVAVPPALAAVAGIEIKRDDKPLSRAEWGLAVPVDPGVHTVEVTAPQKVPWRASEEVKGEATLASIALPDQLQDAPEGAPPLAAKPMPPPEAKPIPPPGAPPRPPKARPPEGGVPTWAWIVGGAGVALTSVGVGFLIDEREAQASIDVSCPNHAWCVDGFDAHAANVRLYRSYGLALGTGIAGVASIGAAVTGVVRSRRVDRAQAVALPWPWLGQRATGLGWEGRF
jgi:hypothetical protein